MLGNRPSKLPRRAVVRPPPVPLTRDKAFLVRRILKAALKRWNQKLANSKRLMDVAIGFHDSSLCFKSMSKWMHCFKSCRSYDHHLLDALNSYCAGLVFKSFYKWSRKAAIQTQTQRYLQLLEESRVRSCKRTFMYLWILKHQALELRSNQAILLAGFRVRSAVSRVFTIWRWHFGSRKAETINDIHASRIHAQSVTKQVLSKWRSFRASRSSERVTLDFADQFYVNSVMSTPFVHWRLAYQHVKLNGHFDDIAYKFRCLKLSALCLMLWRVRLCEDRLVEQQIQSVATPNFIDRLYLKHWRFRCLNFRNDLEDAARIDRPKYLMIFFKKWHKYCLVRSSEEDNIAKAVSLDSHLTMTHTLKVMRDRFKNARIRFRVADVHFQQQLLTKRWGCWVIAAKRCLVLKVALVDEMRRLDLRTKFDALHSWRLMCRLDNRRYTQLMHRYLLKWRLRCSDKICAAGVIFRKLGHCYINRWRDKLNLSLVSSAMAKYDSETRQISAPGEEVEISRLPISKQIEIITQKLEEIQIGKKAFHNRERNIHDLRRDFVSANRSGHKAEQARIHLLIIQLEELQDEYQAQEWIRSARIKYLAQKLSDLAQDVRSQMQHQQYLR